MIRKEPIAQYCVTRRTTGNSFPQAASSTRQSPPCYALNGKLRDHVLTQCQCTSTLNSLATVSMHSSETN